MSDLPLTARYSRGTAIGWQVFLGGGAAAGAALTLAGFAAEARGQSGPAFFIPSLALLIVFGALFMTARGRFGDPAPVISITRESYHDRRLGDPIPWSAIDRIGRHKPGQRLFLLIGTEDPGRWLTGAGILARPMQRINPAMGFPAVVSRLDGLDVPQDRLAEAAEAALAASR